jgi:hypothetical protein
VSARGRFCTVPHTHMPSVEGTGIWLPAALRAPTFHHGSTYLTLDFSLS